MTINNQDEREALRAIIREYMPGADGEPDSQCITDAVLAANFHRTPAPSVVTTVDELEALPDDTPLRSKTGTVAKAEFFKQFVRRADQYPDNPIRTREGFTATELPAAILTPTSPPPSEVRVTGEQVEAVIKSQYLRNNIEGDPDWLGLPVLKRESWIRGCASDLRAAGFVVSEQDVDALLSEARMSFARAANIPVAGEES